MSVACDFCKKFAVRHDDLVFITAPSGMAHICEECVDLCASVIAARKKEEKAECSGVGV